MSGRKCESAGHRRSFSGLVATQRLPANQPGADQAAGVEVVALVPAVVGDLVALVGLDQGDQRAADLDAALVAGVGCAMSSSPSMSMLGGRRDEHS